MKIGKWLILGMAAGFSVSCLWSLLPLFEDRYLVSEPGLVGSWEEGDDTWTFEAGEGLEYLLVQKQALYGIGKDSVPGEAARFRARLGRLGGILFLDLLPAAEGNPSSHNDLLNGHLIPAHSLARVWLGKDSLKLVFLQEDWASKAIEGGRIRLAHVKLEDGIILTAPTAELQLFLLKYAADPEAFPADARPDHGKVELVRAK